MICQIKRHIMFGIVLAHGILVSVFWNSGYSCRLSFVAGDAMVICFNAFSSRGLRLLLSRSILVWECSEISSQI